MQTSRFQKVPGFVAAGYALTVMAVFPLYIDKFTNLGLTKYTGFLSLSIFWLVAFLAACLLAPRRNEELLARLRFGGDLEWPLLLIITNVVSTAFSLSPQNSLWGIGSYYGGSMMVILAGLCYLLVRCFYEKEDVDFWFAAGAVCTCLVVFFAFCNTFDFDPRGCYEGISQKHKEQFLGTMGQQDFNGSFLSLAMPIAIYQFLRADTPGKVRGYGIAGVFCMLALCTINTDSMLLGLFAFGLALICLPSFDTTQLRRGLFLGVAFFIIDFAENIAKTRVLAAGGVINGQNSLCAQFGAPQFAIPGMVLCLAGWYFLKRRFSEKPASLYRAGRIAAVTAVGVIVVMLAVLNLTPLHPDLGGALNNVFYFSKEWGTGRGEIWAASWQMFCDAPLLRKFVGYGPGQLHMALFTWLNEDFTGRLGTFFAAHNEYLELLVSTGILGLLAWLAFVGSHLVRGYRHMEDSRVATLTLALTSFFTQAVVSIRGSMVFPEEILCLAILGVLTAKEPVSTRAKRPAEKESHKEKQKKNRKKPLFTAAQLVYLRRVELLALAILPSIWWKLMAFKMFHFLFV